jgi:hypothetical protein
MKHMSARSLVIEVVAAVVVAVTRVEVVVQTAAVVEMGTGTGVTKYPGAVNYAW